MYICVFLRAWFSCWQWNEVKSRPVRSVDFGKFVPPSISRILLRSLLVRPRDIFGGFFALGKLCLLFFSLYFAPLLSFSPNTETQHPQLFSLHLSLTSNLFPSLPLSLSLARVLSLPLTLVFSQSCLPYPSLSISFPPTPNSTPTPTNMQTSRNNRSFSRFRRVTSQQRKGSHPDEKSSIQLRPWQRPGDYWRYDGSGASSDFYFGRSTRHCCPTRDTHPLATPQLLSLLHPFSHLATLPLLTLPLSSALASTRDLSPSFPAFSHLWITFFHLLALSLSLSRSWSMPPPSRTLILSLPRSRWSFLIFRAPSSIIPRENAREKDSWYAGG